MQVPAYSIFAWRKNDERGRDDVTRKPIPEPNLTRAIRWALERGCDSILIELTGTMDDDHSVTRHLCSDPTCPGGC
jgi:hypothetical protein